MNSIFWSIENVDVIPQHQPCGRTHRITKRFPGKSHKGCMTISHTPLFCVKVLQDNDDSRVILLLLPLYVVSFRVLCVLRQGHPLWWSTYVPLSYHRRSPPMLAIFIIQHDHTALLRRRWYVVHSLITQTTNTAHWGTAREYISSGAKHNPYNFAQFQLIIHTYASTQL